MTPGSRHTRNHPGRTGTPITCRVRAMVNLTTDGVYVALLVDAFAGTFWPGMPRRRRGPTFLGPGDDWLRPSVRLECRPSARRGLTPVSRPTRCEAHGEQRVSSSALSGRARRVIRAHRGRCRVAAAAREIGYSITTADRSAKIRSPRWAGSRTRQSLRPRHSSATSKVASLSRFPRSAVTRVRPVGRRGG
jgi:hypothetical protein